MAKSHKVPKTNKEGFKLVLTLINRSDLARELDVSKQLLSRWNQVPLRYAEQVAQITKLPLGYVVPELESSVSLLLNRPSEKLLPELIKLLS